MTLVGGIKSLLFTYSITSALNKEKRNIAYTPVLYLLYFYAVHNIHKKKDTAHTLVFH